MPKEIEAKFLDIDIDKYRELLKENGCSLVYESKLFRRTAFERCDKTVKGFCRVRDEGNGVTMTSKTYKDPKYAEEVEVSINESYEAGAKFLESLGLIQLAYQESFREKWKHPLAHEITIDILPGVPPYTEIEADTEENLNKIIDILKLDKSKMRFGAFDKTYSEYYGFDPEIINKETPSLTFENVINEIKPLKNHELLERMYNLYKPKNMSRTLKLSKPKFVKKNSKKLSKKISKRTSKQNRGLIKQVKQAKRSSKRILKKKIPSKKNSKTSLKTKIRK
jgi:hypothetical protein